MNDKNIFIYLFLGMGLVLLILGIFYKKWNLYNKLKPRRALGKLFREMLGENGSRNYILFFSIVFLSIGFYTTYNVHIKPNLPERYSKKTDKITLTLADGRNMYTTLRKAENYTDWKFENATLKNNFNDNIPNFIWKINTLKTLNLENNDIENIPIEKLKKSNIKKIILTGNPISNLEIMKIKELGIKVIKLEKQSYE